jgi:hypothetical protein
MISVGKSYMVWSPKKTAKGMLYFKVGDYDKTTKKSQYATVFCKSDIDVNEKEKVFIDKIDGVGLSEWNGKLQVAMFAHCRLDVADALDQMAGDTKAVIDDDMLPF